MEEKVIEENEGDCRGLRGREEKTEQEQERRGKKMQIIEEKEVGI